MRAICTLCVLVIAPTSASSQDAAPQGVVAQPRFAIAPQTPAELQELFRYSGEPLPLVSAHRGGARKGLPENCIATFADTLEHTFAILEIDPRYTRDGAIVVHHDATLDRTTTGEGPLKERTLAEVKQLHLKDPLGTVTEHQIPTLDEVLQWARGKTVLVLDQKDVPVAARVRKVEEHRAEAYAMLIVYSFQDAQTCYGLNPDIMMEVMIPDREKFHAFDRTGVPWRNVVAFVGHTPPQDAQLLAMIHAKGTSCLVGTSRNLDRQFHVRRAEEPAELERDYRALLQFGADLIETDLPREVGTLLYRDTTIPDSRAKFFQTR